MCVPFTFRPSSFWFFFRVDVAVERNVGQNHSAWFEGVVKFPWSNQFFLLITDIKLFEPCFSMVEVRASIVGEQTQTDRSTKPNGFDLDQ